MAAVSDPLPPLGLVERQEVVLLPTERSGGHSIGFTTGAFDADGMALAEFAHRRLRAVNLQPAPPDAAPAERWTGQHLYAGVLFGHYGHFLMESLARLWCFDRHPDLPVVWHVHMSHRQPGLVAWQAALLGMLGLQDRRHLLVRAPVQVESLLVPEPGSVLGERFHPTLAERLAFHPFGEPRPGHRVWLSRSGLTRPGGRIEGEQAVEERLAADGWTIFHPQTLPLPGQLATLGDAEVIAGFAGSAFHTLILGRDVRARVVLLGRGGASGILANYVPPAVTKGLRQVIMPLPLEHVGGTGAHREWRLDSPERALDVLGAGLARLAAAQEDAPAPEPGA